VTAAALLADLRAQGIRLEADGDRLRYHPADRMTAADVEALRAHKPGLLALLRDVASLEADGTAGRLRAVAVSLTPGERARLAAEATAGDVLAQLVIAVLAEAPRAVITADEDPVPSAPCAVCRTLSWWRQPSGLVVCGTCHPRPRGGPTSHARTATRATEAVQAELAETGERLTPARDVLPPQRKAGQRS